MKPFLAAAVCVLAVVGATAQPASAISAWSRRYGADCSMCHWRVNRLNETGKEFLRRGHRLPGEGSEAEGKAIPIDQYWSLTQKIRFADLENIDPSKNTNSRFDVEAFSLYVGGPLDEKYSFFTEQYLHESNKSGADREKLAESYLQWNSSTTDDYTSIRAGQMQPYLLHYHEIGGRLPISRPVVLNDAVASVRVGTTSDGAPLYNIFRPRQRNYGIEVAHNWSEQKTYAALGVVNGTGHAPANIPFDPNGSKDVYLTVEKTFDAAGSSVGLYSYWGEAVLSPGQSTAPQEVGGPEVDFRRIGLVGNYTKSNWSLVGGLIWGEDDVLVDVAQDATTKALSGGTPAGDVESRGYFLQGMYLINPVWSGYLRWDRMEPDRDDAFPGNADVSGPTVGASAILTKYARLSIELNNLETGDGPAQRNLTVEAQWMY